MKNRKIKKVINTIYIIKSNLTDKVYIGQTWDTLEKRFAAHKRRAKNKSKKDSIKLKNSMNKYGIENFYIEKLDETYTQADANTLEDFYILKYDSINNGLNLKRGGAHGEYSEESRKKMSESHMGEKNNNYGLRGPGITFYGGHHTDESKNKISEASIAMHKRNKELGIEISQKQKDQLKLMSLRNAKLNEESVREIKQLLTDGIKQIDIAKLYNVRSETISLIKRGKTWTSVNI